MKKYLVNCASEKFYKRQKKLNESALKFGIDETFSYTDDMLEQTEFYKKNKEIFSHKKGGGYWIWEPYIILEVMKKMKEGDIVFCINSGVEIIDNLNPLVELCKENGIVLFNALDQNKVYTKRDCFVMMDCNSKKYWNSLQVMGGYQIYMKNEKSIQFLNEFLKFAQIPKIINDDPSVTENFPEFKGHKYEQSILSNLAVKYDIKTYRNPSQGGNNLKKPEFRKKGEWLRYPYTYSDKPYKNSDYPTIFYNRRSTTLFRLSLIWLHSKLPVKLKLFIWRVFKNE